MCCSALVFFSETEKDFAVSQTEAVSFHDLVRRLPHSTFLDLTTQTDAPDDAWEEEVSIFFAHHLEQWRIHCFFFEL